MRSQGQVLKGPAGGLLSSANAGQLGGLGVCLASRTALSERITPDGTHRALAAGTPAILTRAGCLAWSRVRDGWCTTAQPPALAVVGGIRVLSMVLPTRPGRQDPSMDHSSNRGRRRPPGYRGGWTLAKALERSNSAAEPSGDDARRRRRTPGERRGCKTGTLGQRPQLSALASRGNQQPGHRSTCSPGHRPVKVLS